MRRLRYIVTHSLCFVRYTPLVSNLRPSRVLWINLFLCCINASPLSFLWSLSILDHNPRASPRYRKPGFISPSSTSSVEFLGEIPAPSSPLQSHDFEDLPFITTHFPQVSSLPPPGTYMISPVVMDLEDLRRVVSTAHSDYGIFVYFPGILLLYSFPVNFFYSFFPPSQLPSTKYIYRHSKTHTHTHNLIKLLVKYHLPNLCNTREIHSYTLTHI